MSDILETIDNALDDWDISCDAMRWIPEKAPEPSPLRGEDFTRRRTKDSRRCWSLPADCRLHAT